jgi:DNA-binding response OmpR family regulator
MKILVVDDDKKIVSMISDFMQINSIETIKCYSGKEAVELSKNHDIQLIILDINMDGINGFDTCKKIREFSNVPIIFLTAKITQLDKILGLGLGADDYITKPFDPLELVARVKANIQRSNSYRNTTTQNILAHKNISVDLTTHKVTINNKTIALSSTEYALLIYLINNSNRIITRKELLINVWNSEIYTENTVNTYIMRLRNKIEKDKNFPESLITIRNEGYLFT